jgi:hypothetical protein
MKVALILSGQFEKDSEAYHSIKKNIIDVYNADIFFAYGWDTPSVSLEEFKEMWKPTEYLYREFPAILGPITNDLKVYPKHSETNLESLVKMWWGIYSSNKLKSNYEQANGFKYDFVIRCRPDLVIHNRLELKPNDIWIPIGWDHRGGINDTFAYGSSEQIDYYAELYNKLHKFASINFILHPESYLKASLERSPYGIMRWYFQTTLRGMDLDKLEYRQK